jgi:aminobenzoyl-glutamate utilization protein B
VAQAWSYFKDVQTKDTKYIPFLERDTPPPTWLNKGILEKYRPEMRKYYYDPSKYSSYLEQLGIKYPTVRTPQTNSQE